MKRRDFMKFIGFSSFAFFASSCGLKKSSEKFIPFLMPPDEGYIPGEPLFRITTCAECPSGCMIEAKLYDKVYNEKRDFFPVKLEGYRDYPFNSGALCIRGQASIQRVYSPSRLKSPLIKDGEKFKETEWNEVYKLILNEIKKGDKFLISGRLTGTGKKLLKEFSEKFNFKSFFYEFYSYSNIRKANEVSFGIKDVPFYNLEDVELLINFGASIFETFLNPLVFSKYYSDKKFYFIHIEPHISLTGMNADLTYRIKPESEIYLLTYLLKSLIKNKGLNKYRKVIEMLPDVDIKSCSEKTGIREEDIKFIEKKYIETEKAMILTGDVSSMSEKGFYLSLLTNVLNEMKGLFNSFIDFTHSYNYEDVNYPFEILREADDFSSKQNSVLFVKNINLKEIFEKEFLEKFLSSFKLKVFFTDSSENIDNNYDIILPLSLFPEFRNDSEPLRGVYTIQNKLMNKLFNTKSFEEILFDLMKTEGYVKEDSYDEYLEKEWEKRFEDNKEEFVDKGFLILNKERKVSLNFEGIIGEFKNFKFSENKNKVLIISPSIRFFDGRSKSIMLLNEIPDPVTSISWGEYVIISEEFAKENDLKNGDIILIRLIDDEIEKPVFISNLLNDDVFLIDKSFYQKPLKLLEDSYDFSIFREIKSVKKTGKRFDLPILSGSFYDYKRILKEGLDEEHRKIKQKVETKKSMYPEHKHNKYRWAMVIDLDKCIGCSACVAACYIENNIPCTGYEEHLKGREMSWIRIEPYYENGKIEFVPMLCQQCHNAPCEPVCPVSATFHNSEGLNVQVYNRCVGTRYCSNNCPFKVRRFNWFDWAKDNSPLKYWTEEMKLMLNPEISKRPKGVMEKCTFCIQRIRRAEDKAKDEKRDVKDGEVIPACMQTCPTKAIIFGNINDKESKVYKHSEKNTFRIFEELGVEPSIYYLKENKDEGEI